MCDNMCMQIFIMITSNIYKNILQLPIQLDNKINVNVTLSHYSSQTYFRIYAALENKTHTYSCLPSSTSLGGVRRTLVARWTAGQQI